MGNVGRGLVRIQVQLEPEQIRALKMRAREEDVSVSNLVREGVRVYMRRKISGEQRKRKAMAFVGIGASGRKDVSRRHDKYLAEGK